MIEPGFNERWVAGRFLALIVMCCVTGCDQQSSPPPPIIQSSSTARTDKPTINAVVPQLPPDDYVGSAVCADCHAEISRTYSATTMANSAAPASTVSKIESFDESWVVMSRLFQARASESAEGHIHEEKLLAHDGSAMCTQRELISYIVGSGKRGRSYLLAHDDQLMMSPLTWYSTASRWDLSPGYIKNNLHFERTIVDECIHCHVGRVAKADSSLPNRFGSPAFIEPGISCERCHGPAGRHVQFRREQKTDRELSEADPIVNPGSLAPHLRESVCNECHQLGVERVLRYGRRVQDFRPGEPLSSVWVVFNKNEDTPEKNGTTNAVNQVRQMELSRCFQESTGRMGCISCHDPHSTPAPETRVQFYRDRCRSCHSKPQSECVVDVAKRVQVTPEDSCIQCHMPALPAADVQHTSQTDHRILRNPEAAPVSDSSETLQLAANMDTIPEWEIRRAKGLLMAQYSVDQNDGALATLATSHLEELQRQGLNDTLVENALGNVYLLLNRLEVAEKHWKRALELDPNNEAALRSLAIAMHDAGRDEEADLYMRKYKKGNQWDRVIIGRHIHLLGRLGRQSEAFAEGEIALGKYPFDRLLREWMANACLANQQKTEAQIHKAIAERLTPGN